MSGALAASHSDRNPAVAKPSIIGMTDVCFTWPVRPRFTLRVSDFQLQAGERVLLIGPSGSGKSTFLSLLAGIVQADSGQIEVLGQDLVTMKGAARDKFRADHMGIIFQMFNLLPYGSVTDNVLLPLSFSSERRGRAVARGGATAEALRLLKSLGLEDGLIKGASAAGLSVGQQQRVAAARALIGAPQLIIADEPTSSLDRDRQRAFLDLLFAEMATVNASLVMVSHDESLAGRFDRVQRLDAIATTEREMVS